MRMNIDIDDELLAEAMRATGQTTKKAAIEEALRLLLAQAPQRQAFKLAHQRAAINASAGIGWDGDLDAMRLGKDW